MTYSRPIFTRHLLKSPFGKYSKTSISCEQSIDNNACLYYSSSKNNYRTHSFDGLDIIGNQRQNVVWKLSWNACNRWLTASPSITTPCSRTTLGCLNCPIMAASWRNLTLSISDKSTVRLFTATCIDSWWLYQVAFLTFPNWPEPKWEFNLY